MLDCCHGLGCHAVLLVRIALPTRSHLCFMCPKSLLPTLLDTDPISRSINLHIFQGEATRQKIARIARSKGKGKGSEYPELSHKEALSAEEEPP